MSLVEVSKGTKIRNRYNQVPHLTRGSVVVVLLLHVLTIDCGRGGLCDGLWFGMH